MLFQRHDLNPTFLHEQSGKLSTSSYDLQTCCGLLIPGSPAEEHGGGLSLRVRGWPEDKKPATPRRRKGTSCSLIPPVTVSSGFLHTHASSFAVSTSLGILPRENKTAHQKSTQRQIICKIPQLSADQASPWGLCWQGFPTILFHSSPSPLALVAPSAQLLRQPN